MPLVFIVILPVRGEAQTEFEYAIGAKDLLQISVFDVPELNITVRVSEDGSINLPLLGKVEVKGLTRFEVEKRIAALLEKNYLKNPQVTVFIKEYLSKKVSVVGAVKNPGNYELIGRQTILEIISTAGGLTSDASDRIIVIRQLEEGNSTSLVIQLEDLVLEGNPKYNIPLLPGDIINIPAVRFMSIYVFGQVKNPGLIKMSKDASATVMRAIAQAGGFTERASRTAVTVTRMEKGKEIKVKVNLRRILTGRENDYPLLDGDVIYVPESIL